MSRKRRAVLNAGKAQYVSPNRGLKLLDEAIEQIELHNQAAIKETGLAQWHQEEYRCASGMCLAGWISQLAGGEWYSSATEGGYADELIAVPEDDEDVLMVHGRPTATVDAHYRATRLLGPDVTDWEADDLFAGDNTLDYIKNCRDDIAERLNEERGGGA